MKIPQLSLLEWQQRFGTEEACIAEFVQVRWPDGFICPECAAREYSFITTRHVYQCCNLKTELTKAQFMNEHH